MGELTRGPGNEWRYVIRDFSRGMAVPGPTDAAATLATDRLGEGFFPRVLNARSESGLYEPIMGDDTFTASGLAETTVIDLIAPYTSTNTLILAISSARLSEINVTTGADTSISTSAGSSGVKRTAAQFMTYEFIGGSGEQMYQYNADAPGSAGAGAVAKLGFAGTKAPTTFTVAVVGTSASELAAVGYKYRVAWEYGTADPISGRGELGMGWVQSVGLVTPTPATDFLRLSGLPTSPPSNYAHAVARSIWRTAEFFNSSYFLVTRQTSFASATYDDGASDASITLGEETDPIDREKGADTGADPDMAEFLPPSCHFLATHEGRLWGLDIEDSGNRYPTRAVYSRIAGLAPHPSQFHPAATVEASGGVSVGTPAGLAVWQNNLWAIFENGISVLSSDPGPGALPAFAIAAFGFGAVAPQSIAVSPFGIFMVSRQGPLLFDGGPTPRRIGDTIAGRLRGLTLARMRAAVGGYDADTQEYVVSFPDVADNIAFAYVVNAAGGAGYWYECTGGVTSRWSYAALVGGELYYGRADGVTQNHIYKRGQRTLGSGVDTIARALTTKYDDFEMPHAQKTLRSWLIEFTEDATLTSNDNVVLRSDGGVGSGGEAVTITLSGAGRVTAGGTTITGHTIQFEVNLTQTGVRDKVLRSIELRGISHPEQVVIDNRL